MTILIYVNTGKQVGDVDHARCLLMRSQRTAKVRPA